MNTQQLIAAWIEGANICTLAALLGEDPRGVENEMRMEFRRLADEGRAEMRERPAAAVTVTEAKLRVHRQKPKAR